MSFFISNIALPVLLAICVGLPLSIYAGFICGRIVVFHEIKNRVNEVITANAGPFNDSTQIRSSRRSVELLSVISQRLSDQGNVTFSDAIYDIGMQLDKALGKLESQFEFSEARMKHDPPSSVLSNDDCRTWYSVVDNGRASLRYILSLRPIV